MWRTVEDHYHSPMLVPTSNETIMFTLAQIVGYPNLGGKLVAECFSPKAEPFTLEVPTKLFAKLEKVPEGAFIILTLSDSEYEIQYWDNQEGQLTPMTLKDEPMVDVTSNAIKSSTITIDSLAV